MASNDTLILILLFCISLVNVTTTKQNQNLATRKNHVFMMRQQNLLNPVILNYKDELNTKKTWKTPKTKENAVRPRNPKVNEAGVISVKRTPCLPSDGLACGPGTRWRRHCSSGLCLPGPREHCYVPCNYTAYFSPTEADVAFYLYTRNISRRHPRGIRYTTRSWQKVPSELLAGTVRFFVHGWHDNYATDYALELVQQLNHNRDRPTTAVFSVDWRRLADSDIFFPSCDATEYVGRTLAKFIKLLEKKGASRRRMHLIGFSLGGKVVSAAGRNLRSPKVARISGIDSPTGCFVLSCGANLQSGDASFVDSLHNTFISGPTQQAHADFYPNGPHECLKEIVFHPIRTILTIHEMHEMAVQYYIYSINICKYSALACPGWKSFPDHCEAKPNRMGFYAKMPPCGTRKKYYLAPKETDLPCLL